MKYITFDVLTYLELIEGLILTKSYDLDMKRGKCMLSTGIVYPVLDIYRIIYN